MQFRSVFNTWIHWIWIRCFDAPVRTARFDNVKWIELVMATEFTARVIKCLSYVVPVVVVLLVIALVVPAIQLSRLQARKSQSKNNLKQLGLALQGYHDVNNMLPYGGVFDAKGVPYHGWTIPLIPYTLPYPHVLLIDTRFPWDDPVNIDKSLHEPGGLVQDPSIREVRSPDGFPLSHFAANQRLFYRNSVVRLNDIPVRSATILLGEANGSFVPFGYPFNWRDLSLGLKLSPDGFGSPSSSGTLFLFADGSVRWLDNKIDADIARAYAGPAALKPTPQQIAKPGVPYRLATQEYWRYRNVFRTHEELMSFRLSPDRKYLGVDFRNYDKPEEAHASRWISTFDELVAGASIEHVELTGHLRAQELVPFLSLPALKHLTLTYTTIADDAKSVLATARKGVVIDPSE